MKNPIFYKNATIYIKKDRYDYINTNQDCRNSCGHLLFSNTCLDGEKNN